MIIAEFTPRQRAVLFEIIKLFYNHAIKMLDIMLGNKDKNG